LDISKFKGEVYDFLALVLPGLLVICAFWITWRGWHTFVVAVGGMSAVSLTVLLFFCWALGPLIQEIADSVVAQWKGSRYLKISRDEFWKSTDGIEVKKIISQKLGHEVTEVDVAFNYCLTRVQKSFAKRDMFMANSDFARSMVVTVWCAFPPLVREIHHSQISCFYQVLICAGGALLILGTSRLFWRRMTRFRDFADRTVFHVYLSHCGEGNNEMKGESNLKR
jgi:hypothetical protein